MKRLNASGRTYVRGRPLSADFRESIIDKILSNGGDNYTIFQVDLKMLQSTVKYLEVVQKMYGGVCAESLLFRGTQRQFSENICSEDGLRSRIFETFVVKFLACLPVLGLSNF